MNGYFQIVNRNDKIQIKLVPPTGDGEPISHEELTDYLSVKNVEYDIKLLYSTLNNLSATTFFPTNTEYRFNDTEYVKVSCSPDNMTAYVRVIPPFEEGKPMPKEEFLREFSAKGVVFGIDDAAVDKFIKERNYCTTIEMAHGKPVVQGTDASIEYFFNTDPRVRPTLNEDGTVDFFHLNTINHCKKDDLLARLTPAVLGKNGTNVKGEILRPREVKAATLKFGHNIAINEEKTELRSEVSGHVSLAEGKVFVSNVFEVENVDNSIGNIEYDGNVCVNGNVCENFSIKANGSIEVKGVVEGAYLESDGDIIIARGMNGMHKGVLKAKGNVVAKFLENAKVTADGYVESESILHSVVVAGLDVKVTGKRGFISGGRTCATNSIEVKNLGSSMGADTIVEVGMDTTVKTRMQELQKEILEINKQLNTIRPVLESAKMKLAQKIQMSTEQLLQLQKIAKLSKDLTDKYNAATEELELFQKGQDSESIKGQVIVTGDVYPGTKICIGDVSMVVKSAMKYCRFVKEGGEVKMVAIY